MKKNYLKVLLFNLALIPATFAQEAQSAAIDWQNVREGETVEYCKEHKKTNEYLNNPEFAKQWEKDRAQLAEEQAQLLASSRGEIPGKGVVYRVPVVIHVLHNGGVENISREQIENAMNILNRDYRRLNSDADNVHAPFQGMPADIEVEFVLATKAPNGQCFSGVTRTQNAISYNGSNGRAQVNAIIQGNDVFNGQWPGNRYMNVFVCGDIGGAAGYTYRPTNFGQIGSTMYNGIWVLHEYVGAIGTGSAGRSRTLTHEAGHWLDLPHTWGGTNNPGLQSNCSDDDNISDTPNTVGVEACFLQESSCGPVANVENYMDYSYCSKMFTPGQATRMRTALNSSVGGRNNIHTAANIAATGADSNFVLCAADFRATKSVLCPGESVDFFDESYNSVSGWTWTFQGGSPATSTAQNPTVTYNTAGTYEVTLVATDGGTSQTTTKTAFITVLPNGINLPYSEPFENYTSLSAPSSFWTVENLGGNGFDLTTTVGASGTNSIRLRNFGQASGSVDAISSNNFDLSNISSSSQVTMSFVYASRKRNSSNNEKLQIQVSKDCGETFSARKTISGNTLTSETASTEWEPTADDWVQVHVTNIASSFFESNVQVKFEFTSDGGNNLYIDDINFYEGDPSQLGVAELESVNNITLYPNPAEDELNVKFNAANDGLVQLDILDLTGKVLRTINVQASSGSNLVIVDSDQMATGMYLLRINSNNAQKTMQFIVK